MRVLLNATDGPLSVRAVRRYVTEMVTGLGSPTCEVDLHLVFFTHRRRLVRRFLQDLPDETEYTLHWLPLPRRLLGRRHRRPRWELRRLAREVDLYHETTTDSPDFEDLPVVATIHGLCPLVAPELLDANYAAEKADAYRRTVTLSDYFAPVSDTTRREFLEFFPVEPAGVRSIPLGVSHGFHPRPDNELRALLSDLGVVAPYLLYVGGIQPNKNIPRLLRTFARLTQEGIFEGQLILAGDQHYSEDRWESLIELEGIADRVVLPGFFAPTDPRLAALYAGARLFLFPSLYEGWTSPPLEAMASGVPVIASNASSIPETVGDAAILCAPADENAWVLSATRLLTNPDLEADYRSRGLARAKQFPWSATVEKTTDFYRDVLSGSNSGTKLRDRDTRSPLRSPARTQ